jgi:hypothetical protein
VELAVVAAMALILPLPLYSMAKHNAQGAGYVIIMIVIGGVAAAVGMAVNQRSEAGYDEREKKIRNKAFRWGSQAFIGYGLAMAWAAFFIIGGGGVVRVVHLPVFFYVGLFVAQITQTAVMLILYNMSESDDE